MDVTELVDAVRSEKNTELSRLGSSKTLYADTEGEMEPEAVLVAAADFSHHAATVFEEWAKDAEGNLAMAYETVGEGERDHHAAVVDELDDYEIGDRPAVVRSLANRTEPVERLGALAGWTLVAEKKASQSTGFFTGQADPSTADLFREFGDDYDAYRTDVDARLAEQCESDDDWADAEAAAAGTVQAAYEEYVERLESMGVNPKPVC